MTVEEMINDFSGQKDEIVKEIKELESEILKKKEQFFRLQGAVEALVYAKNSGEGLCLEEDCSGTEQTLEELPPEATDTGIADPIV